MKVLILKDGNFVEKEIDGTLESLQSIVGGYIEVPSISTVFDKNGIAVIVNEEGKLLNLTPSIAIVRNHSTDIIDYCCGTIIFTGTTEDDFTDISEEQINIVKYELNHQGSLLLQDGNNIYNVKVLCFDYE